MLYLLNHESSSRSSTYALCTFTWLLVQANFHVEQPLEKYEHKKACCFPGNLNKGSVISRQILDSHYLMVERNSQANVR